MNVVVLTVSDRASRGEYEDLTGPAVRQHLRDSLDTSCAIEVVPDDKDLIIERLIALCDSGVDIVLTAGGTGLSARDVTPEATRAVIERDIPGIAESMRARGRIQTPLADLSRGIAGQRGHSLIINLPGSPQGAVESLDAIAPVLAHAVDVMGRAT